jgi:hypothetical protein
LKRHVACSCSLLLFLRFECCVSWVAVSTVTSAFNRQGTTELVPMHCEERGFSPCGDPASQLLFHSLRHRRNRFHFYGTPSPKTVQNWYDQTPPNFLLSLERHHPRRTSGRLPVNFGSHSNCLQGKHTLTLGNFRVIMLREVRIHSNRFLSDSSRNSSRIKSLHCDTRKAFRITSLRKNARGYSQAFPNGTQQLRRNLLKRRRATHLASCYRFS